MGTLPAVMAIFVLDFIHFSSSSEIHVQKGLPVAIACDVDFGKDVLQDSEKVLCWIEQNSTVVLNKTITWGEREETEFIFDADINETTTVFVIRGNRTVQRNTTIVVHEPYDVCSTGVEQDNKGRQMVVGKAYDLLCKVPTNSGIPKSKFKEVNFAFFKDCQRINLTENVTPVRFYGSRKHLGLLKIKHVSYRETPGSYRCAVLYKERQYIFPMMRRYIVCVKAEIPADSIDNPLITPAQNVYKKASGQILTMTCTVKGRTGGTGNNMVFWHRDGVQLPEPEHGVDPNQFGTTIEEGERCTPDPNVNVTELVDKLGSITSIYTLRNLKVSDSGTYSCRLVTLGYPVNSTFTVVVATPASSLAKPWVIAVAVVAVCLVIVILAIALRYTLRREMRFFMKKYFTNPVVVSGDQSVAFLVYCEDVFRMNIEENPLKDVVAWMDQNTISYTDPNKHCHAIKHEDPVAKNMTEVIKESKSLIIILSKDLLIKNDIEIFTSYMALNGNVESSQSVIFICTKEMKKIVFETGKFPETQLEPTEQEAVTKTTNTFKSFMKRRGNFAISWSPQKISHFRKDLYVALPKVKTLKKSIEDEPILASSGLV